MIDIYSMVQYNMSFQCTHEKNRSQHSNHNLCESFTGPYTRVFYKHYFILNTDSFKDLLMMLTRMRNTFKDLYCYFFICLLLPLLTRKSCEIGIRPKKKKTQ